MKLFAVLTIYFLPIIALIAQTADSMTELVFKNLPVVIDLVKAGNWLGLSILVINLLVYVLKNHVNFLGIPKRFRLLFVTGLGIAAAGLSMVAGGTSWIEAFIVCLSAPSSMWLHQFVKVVIMNKKKTIKNFEKDMEAIDNKLETVVQATEKAVEKTEAEIKQKMDQKAGLGKGEKDLRNKLAEIRDTKAKLNIQGDKLKTLEDMVAKRLGG